jgi:hypothetical protein
MLDTPGKRALYNNLEVARENAAPRDDDGGEPGGHQTRQAGLDHQTLTLLSLRASIICSASTLVTAMGFSHRT